MKHIKTASELEANNRKTYAEAKNPEPILAGEEQLALLKEIAEKTLAHDQLEYEISEAKGKLMGFIGEHYAMKNAAGVILVNWGPGAMQKKVDYEGLLIALKAPADVVAKYTKQVQKARTFKIEDVD